MRVEPIKEETNMGPVMMDFLKDELLENEARCEARGEAKAYHSMGLSEKEIAERMNKSPSEVRELLRKKETAVV